MILRRIAAWRQIRVLRQKLAQSGSTHVETRASMDRQLFAFLYRSPKITSVIMFAHLTLHLYFLQTPLIC